jgi:CubicO group peptidase (beta-lactamase class C family)
MRRCRRVPLDHISLLPSSSVAMLDWQDAIDDFLSTCSNALREDYVPMPRLRYWTASFLVCWSSLFCAAQGKPAVSSESVNSALAQLDPYIRSSLDSTKVPGISVAVVYNDQVVFLRGYGIRKIGEPAQVDPDTVFEIASFSKPITSTILASLVGQRQISWDDRIVDIDPGFRLSSPDTTRQITIRDFLSHRSGLATESGDLLEDLGYSRPDILYRMRYLPLPGHFRKTYAYSNFGYTTGAIAAATKIGKPWETIAEEQLYSRLGMTSTSSRFSDYEDRANKAALHIFINGKPVNRFVREADAEAPAGGVSSSARDLAEWIRLQLNDGKWNGKQIIDANALAETHKPQVCRNPADPAKPNDCPGDQYYGLGWNVGTNAEGHAQVSHSGAFFLGAATAVYLVPEEHLGVLALGNSMPIGLPEAICLHFLDLVHYGKPQREYLPLLAKIFSQMIASTEDSSPDYARLAPPKTSAPAKPLSAYAGKYTNEYFGTLEVSVEDNGLILRLPPRGSYYELSHWDGETFTYYFASESTGSGRRGAKFSLDKKQVLIENLSPEHDAVFTKSQPVQ